MEERNKEKKKRIRKNGRRKTEEKGIRGNKEKKYIGKRKGKISKEKE